MAGIKRYRRSAEEMKEAAICAHVSKTGIKCPNAVMTCKHDGWKLPHMTEIMQAVKDQGLDAVSPYCTTHTRTHYHTRKEYPKDHKAYAKRCPVEIPLNELCEHITGSGIRCQHRATCNGHVCPIHESMADKRTREQRHCFKTSRSGSTLGQIVANELST